MPTTDRYVTFDGMVWPNPRTVVEVEHRLRYQWVSGSDRLVAAAVISAYRKLIELPQGTRNQRIKAIRLASTTTAEPSPSPESSRPVSTDEEEGGQGLEDGGLQSRPSGGDS